MKNGAQPVLPAQGRAGDPGVDGAPQLIQPIAHGAALGIHPLAVLIVTIAGGALFGTIGLILAAAVTSAAVHVSADLARARGPRLAGGAPRAGRRAAGNPRSGRHRNA
jgi:hypothetical protein